MHLRVFADDSGGLRLEISSPALAYRRRLFLPMFASSALELVGIAEGALVGVWYEGALYKVPYLLVHSEEMKLEHWTHVGEIEEDDSRNVLNHILDILAWD